MKTITGKIIALAIAVSGLIFSQSANAACNMPTTLSTTAITSAAATLNWTGGSSAIGFNLRYRVVGNTTWITTTSTVSPKAISGLSSSSSYEWQVQTRCSATQTSNWTGSSTFATLIVCNTPTGLNTTSITTTGATLNWSTVTGAASYNVQYRITGAPSWTTTTSTTNSKSLTSLTSNSAYEFQVQTNCGGTNTSAFSSSATFSTPVVCNVPTGLIVTDIAPTTATLKWNAMANAAGYNIEYRQTGAPSWTTLSSVTNVVMISSLTVSTSYEWKVQTNCGNSNQSAFSSAITFTTAAFVSICYIPGGLNVPASDITSTSAIVTWTASQNAVGYNLMYRVVGAPAWVSVSTTATTLTVNLLSPATNYELQLQGVCANSNLSSYSSIVSFTTSPANSTICDVPSGLIALGAGITSTSANVSWTATLTAVSYDVEYRVVGAPSWTPLSTSVTSVNLTSLIPSTNYEWRVQGNCGGNGVSGFSGTPGFNTLAPPVNTVCNIVPSNLSTSSVTEKDATLSWTGGPEASIVGGVAGYEVQYRQTGAPSWTSIFVTTPYLVIPSLLPALTYEWQVRTDCGSSNFSSFSSTLSFTTLSHTAPNTATGPNPPITTIPDLNDLSTWNVIFVSSGDLATDEQIVHDWMLLHGIIKQ